MFYDKSPIARNEWLLETSGDCLYFGTLGVGGAALVGGGSALSGITSLVGGGKQASAATKAAQIQANAYLQAANLQQQRYQETKGALDPYITSGTSYLSELQNALGIGTTGGVLGSALGQQPAQWSPTMAQLQNMPGYQFQLQQGLLAAQSNVASAGLGRSGAAVKAASTFASGLAAEDWYKNWQQFQGQQTLNLQGRAQTYNELLGGVDVGLKAGGALAGVGVTSAQNVGSALSSAGTSTAAGTTSAAASQTGGLTGASGALSSGLTSIALLGALQPKGSTGSDTVDTSLADYSGGATGTGWVWGQQQPA